MTSEEKKKALTNPSSIFRNPAEVVRSRDFDISEKSKILAQWELDARLLQVATEEGMAEGERSLFADVREAQKRLGVEHLHEDGAPSKVGP